MRRSRSSAHARPRGRKLGPFAHVPASAAGNASFRATHAAPAANPLRVPSSHLISVIPVPAAHRVPFPAFNFVQKGVPFRRPGVSCLRDDTICGATKRLTPPHLEKVEKCATSAWTE